MKNQSIILKLTKKSSEILETMMKYLHRIWIEKSALLFPTQQLRRSGFEGIISARYI